MAPAWSFVWQALHLVTSTFTLCGTRGMHLVTSTFTLCGRCGTYGTGLALVACLVPVCRHCPRRGTWRHRPALCVAGVALMALRWLWWRAWFPFVAVVAAALCVAGVAFRSIDLHSVWQAWHLATSTFTLSGRRGNLWDWAGSWFPFVAVVAAALCVAGVCRRGIRNHRPPFCVADVTSTFTLCGRRGVYGAGLANGGTLGSRLSTLPSRSLCGRPGSW